MSKKQFTNEEIAALKANPYTFTVTTNQITYTKEFKELFWSDYQKRITPSKIFQKYGYDPKVIGRSRITGFQQTLKKESEAGMKFRDGKRPSGTQKEMENTDEPYSNTIRDLQQRVDYLEQEVEFLKKISSARNSRK